ncbi:MAG: InlB B-repeat-containing protein, partial [Clostridia bacterium]|nr:InlB B-repeat-containing protein [Clostridia bacterium]
PQDLAGASNTADVMASVKTDYVNYKLATPIEATVANEVYRVEYGTLVNFEDLFTRSKNDWAEGDLGLKDDYVEKIEENDFPDGGYTATENKSFTYTFGIKPINTTSKGTVDDLVYETYTSLNASVEVYSKVTTNLTHMEFNRTDSYTNKDEVDYGHNLTASLKAESGYINPQLTSITSGGTELEADKDYKYDVEYGELVIYAEAIKGEIVITAKADAQKYHMYFIAYDENAQVMNELTNVNDDTYANNKGQYNGTFPDVYEYAETNISGRAPVISDELRDSKIGYQFKCVWGTDNNEPITEMPAHNVWVYGTYVPYTYTLTINYVDESGNPVANPYVNNKVYYGLSGCIASPVVSGKELKNTSDAAYNFTIDKAFLDAQKVDITGGDITVNIVYVEKDHVITLRYFDDTTGLVLGENKYIKYAESGSSYTLTESGIPKPGGYTFSYAQYYPAGSENQGGSFNLPLTIGGITMDSDIIVDIYYVPEYYKVTFEENKQKSSYDDELYVPKTITEMPAAIEDIDYMADIAEPASPSAVGYKFDGWYMDADCNDAWVFKTESAAGNPVTGDTALFAKWTPRQYDITFVYNDGTTKTTSDKVTYDAKYGDVLPTPERKGYGFDGWFTESTGGTKVTADTVYNPDEPKTHKLHAQWTPLDYTLRFMKTNDEMFKEFQRTFATSFNVKDNVGTPELAGFTFLGWKSSDTDLLDDLTGNETITVPAGDVTFTAQWEENRNIVVTVLDKDGDPITNATLELKAGDDTVMSNDEGQYTFEKPANGTYTVEATVAARADIG